MLRQRHLDEVLFRVRELRDAVCSERCNLGFCAHTGIVDDELKVLSFLESRGMAVTAELERWQSENGGAFPVVGSGSSLENQLARKVVRAIADYEAHYLRIWSHRSVGDWFAVAWPELDCVKCP